VQTERRGACGNFATAILLSSKECSFANFLHSCYYFCATIDDFCVHSCLNWRHSLVLNHLWPSPWQGFSDSQDSWMIYSLACGPAVTYPKPGFCWWLHRRKGLNWWGLSHSMPKNNLPSSFRHCFSICLAALICALCLDLWELILQTNSCYFHLPKTKIGGDLSESGHLQTSSLEYFASPNGPHLGSSSWDLQ